MYSVMGFLDKGFVGVVVLIIQTFYPDSPDGYVLILSCLVFCESNSNLDLLIRVGSLIHLFFVPFQSDMRTV